MDERRKDMLTRKALFLTNTAFLLADVANSFLTDAETTLENLKQGFSQEQKRLFGRAMDAAKQARIATKNAAGDIYQLKDAGDACDDSDFLRDAITLIIDRTGDNEKDNAAMLDYLRQKPPVMGLEYLLEEKYELQCKSK